MEMKISQRNTEGQAHGYCNSEISYLDLKTMTHYYKDNQCGYIIAKTLNGTFLWEGHCINGEEIGYEHIYMVDTYIQYYYNKPGKTFGEQIKWK